MTSLEDESVESTEERASSQAWLPAFRRVVGLFCSYGLHRLFPMSLVSLKAIQLWQENKAKQNTN